MTAERYIYALTSWTVEKREKGWYFAQSARRHRHDDWRGPYRSEASVALVIARQLRREIIERYTHQVDARPIPAPARNDGPEARFRNHYRCDQCDGEWTDEWSCQCDDDCPHCGARHMSPYKSDDLGEIP